VVKMEFREAVLALTYRCNSKRGVPGAYERVLDSVAVLKEAMVRDLGFSFTIIDENIGYINEMYDFASTP